LRRPAAPGTSTSTTASTGTTTSTIASAGATTSAAHPHATAPATTTTASAAPVASGSAEVRAAGHLALYGDPGTRAIVDGVSKGKCPLVIPVEPGEHDVRFVFDPTGDSSGTHVTVKADARVKVVSDFTGATPTVRVRY